MEQQFALAKVLEPRQAAAAIEVFHEIAYTQDVVFQELAERRGILFHFEPELQVILVREVFARHIPRIAAVGHLANRIDAKEWDQRSVGLRTHPIVWDKALAGDDEPLGGTGEFDIR